MTIVGVGLIGGSLGMVCKQQRLVAHIVGTGRRIENLKKAVEFHAIDRFTTHLEDSASGTDLLVLATPVATFEAILKVCIPHLALDAVVTDVGSVKGTLVARMEDLVPDAMSVVGAHPIAGKEKSGINAASLDLFHGARCILTPTTRTKAPALLKVRHMWEAAGARITEMDPELHDRVLGAVSHLPHILSFALVSELIARDNAPELLGFAAGGFRDFTRIAASSPQMWRDIALQNRDALLAEIDRYGARLAVFRELIERGEAAGLERLMTEARTARANWAAGAKRPASNE